MFSLIVTRVEIARRDEAKAVDGVSMISPLSLERLTRVLDDDSPTPQNAEKLQSNTKQSTKLKRWNIEALRLFEGSVPEE